MTEPKAELNAILESKESLGFYPVSIFRYALLDAISSPFLNMNKPMNTLTIIPSWFIMNQPVDKLVVYGDDVEKLEKDSYKEADNLKDPVQLVQFTRKFIKHLYGINLLEPEDSDSIESKSSSKKVQTAS